MFRIQAPILTVPTAEARLALGRRLRWAGLAAYREIAVAAKGLEIAHLQFTFFDLTLAVCSHIRRDGLVEIEIGLATPAYPPAPSRRAAPRSPRLSLPPALRTFTRSLRPISGVIAPLLVPQR